MPVARIGVCIIYIQPHTPMWGALSHTLCCFLLIFACRETFWELLWEAGRLPGRVPGGHQGLILDRFWEDLEVILGVFFKYFCIHYGILFIAFVYEFDVVCLFLGLFLILLR